MSSWHGSRCCSLTELIAVRGRRLYSIARLSIYESNRRMWAPWVVITVFLLVLAFTHWFLQPPRAAEMGRLYVGTLSLLCSVLLTVMVTILTPLSLPTDIQQQTIYTVVSKPVRRLELIWGRMIGYMALVTVLVAVFGGISLVYLWRTVGQHDRGDRAAGGEGAERGSHDRLQGADGAGRPAPHADVGSRSDQGLAVVPRLARHAARRGNRRGVRNRRHERAAQPHRRGDAVDGHLELRHRPRSVHAAGPAAAVMLDRRIPVDDFLSPDTIEWQLDRVYDLTAQIETAKRAKEQPNVPASKVAELDAAIARNQAELDGRRSEYDSLTKRADDLKATGDPGRGRRRYEEGPGAHGTRPHALSSKPITVEMTFNVYRTTKGKVGEPVYAEIQAINPRTGREFEGDVFPIKEYYTNRVQIPASILAGSGGALRIEIRCLSPTQYLGMAESDLYLLATSGNFGFNYMKGLFGVWLQAMVLTAIGVCAGTFLSWPVALLTTIAFFVAGQLAFAFLVDFSRQAILGGGPFESLIRILTHDNQMSELTPTAGVVLAKTLDSLVMPVMSMMVYLVPNFQALDVSNMVADGFMVSWRTMGLNTLLALAYALPFSFAGYLILKNREVAA